MIGWFIDACKRRAQKMNADRVKWCSLKKRKDQYEKYFFVFCYGLTSICDPVVDT